MCNEIKNHLEQPIKEYLGNNNFEYALMINGEWGSGKTHYLEHNLKKYTEKTIYYLSVNGLSSNDEFSEKLIFTSTQRENNKLQAIAKLGRQSLSKAANFFLGVNFNVRAETILKLISFENCVLIIDDLERLGTQINVLDFIGFVRNNIVENLKLKVVIICDEIQLTKQLDAVTRNKYEETKEKTIWKTLNFELNIEGAVFDIISKITNDDYKTYVENNKTIFLHLLKIYKILNLRTVLYYLECLEKIYLELNTQKNEIQQMVWNSLLIYCHEHKKGNLTTKFRDEIPIDIRNIISIPVKPNEKSEPKDSYISNFGKIYKKANSKIKYRYFKSLFHLACHSYYSNENFTQELNDLKEILSQNSQWKKSLNILKNAWSNEEEDFHNAWIDTFEFIKKDKYSLDELKYIAYLFEIHKYESIELPIDKNDLFKEILIRISKTSNFEHHRIVSHMMYKKILGRNYSAEFQEISDLYDERIREKLEIQFKHTVDTIFAKIKRLDPLDDLSLLNFFSYASKVKIEALAEFISNKVKNTNYFFDEFDKYYYSLFSSTKENNVITPNLEYFVEFLDKFSLNKNHHKILISLLVQKIRLKMSENL